MSEANYATARNTLSMLEQQYLMAKYGISWPSPPRDSSEPPRSQLASEEVASGSPTERESAPRGPAECIKIDSFDSSVLSSNTVFVELAWKVDLTNSCPSPFGVNVHFTIYDAQEFELDSDEEQVLVPANGVGKARGKMLVSPPEKARRMAKQGASYSLR